MSESIIQKLREISNKCKLAEYPISIGDNEKFIVRIKPHLDFYEFGNIVSTMNNANFTTEGRYAPWVANVLFVVKVVEAYIPDIQFSHMDENGNVIMDMEIDEAYEFIINMELYDKVLEKIGDTSQFQDLRKSVDDILAYNISQNSSSAQINNMINSTTSMINALNEKEEKPKRARKGKVEVGD